MQRRYLLYRGDTRGEERADSGRQSGGDEDCGYLGQSRLFFEVIFLEGHSQTNAYLKLSMSTQDTSEW